MTEDSAVLPEELLDANDLAPLLAGLGDVSPEVRVATFEALTRLPLGVAAWVAVGAYAQWALDDAAQAERLAVIEGAPAIPIRSVRDRVVQLAEVEDTAIQDAAVRSAAAFGDPRVARALLAGVGNVSDAAQQTARMDVSKFATEIYQHFDKLPKSDAGRFWLALALARSGNHTALQTFFTDLQSGRTEIPHDAQRVSPALLKVLSAGPPSTSTLQWLAKVARRKNPTARALAATLLRGLNTDTSRPAPRPDWEGGEIRTQEKSLGFTICHPSERAAATEAFSTLNLADVLDPWGGTQAEPDTMTEVVRRGLAPAAITLLFRAAARTEVGEPTWHDINMSNNIVRWVEVQDAFRPDLEGLYDVYRHVARCALHGAGEDSAAPPWISFAKIDDEGGPRSFCYQIGWTVSRGGLKALVMGLSAHLASSTTEERLTATYLVADAAAYATHTAAPLFGGGFAPERQVTEELLEDTGLNVYRGSRPVDGEAFPVDVAVPAQDSFDKQDLTSDRPTTVHSSGAETREARDFLRGDSSEVRPAADRAEGTEASPTRAGIASPREIAGWLEPAGGSLHHLHLEINVPRERNLISGRRAVDAAEIPDSGLHTSWILVSPCPLHALDATTQVEYTIVEDREHWTGTFELTIPRTGASEERVLGVELGDTAVDVTVMIFAPAGLYRELTLRLPPRTADAVTLVENVADTSHLVDASAGIRPAHEWTTPPGEVALVVIGDSVVVEAKLPNYELRTIALWTGTAAIANLVEKVRAAAESFRNVASAHLDDIEAEDLDERLAGHFAHNDWGDDPNHADEHHETEWATLSRSSELYDLAGAGYELYRTLFRERTPQRQVLDRAPLGSRVDIHWTVDTMGAVGGVPWTLLATSPPAKNAPVDAMSFLGLRFRIAHTKYPPWPEGTSMFLGDPTAAHMIDVLFWGEQDEPVSAESRRQRAWLRTRPNHVVVPADAAPDPFTAAARVLDDPAPAPVACLYLYCEHDAGRAGAEPRLRFGSGIGDQDVLDESAFGFGYPDRPLVFANACGTGSAAAYRTPALEQRLFNNGCRAYIATETNVPVVLASRLAQIFFALFEGRASGYALPAGEALSLARRFLWLQYRNPGGLLYGYVNQYGVVLAGEHESKAVNR